MMMADDDEDRWCRQRASERHTHTKIHEYRKRTARKRPMPTRAGRNRTLGPQEKMSVIIEQGTLKGLQHTTRLSNKPFVSFLGIPYAKPPVGDLRFKVSVKHPGWFGIFEAFSEGNKCTQNDSIKNETIGSEDCLYLNVFVPQEESNEKKAVMIYIHGGSFNKGSGSTDEFSPDNLIDENVIVVTINYRLNVLGFLNFDTDECPGNMGLKDQLLAIKWVKSNISAFGGDAENITIFGESAGSASVHCHTLSPLSTGLFQKAIMQSGCMFNPWALQENHREAAFKFAKLLGCKKDDPKEIVQYLLTIPAIDLVGAIKHEEEANLEFIPSVENDTVHDQFLPTHPEVLAKTANPGVLIISGLNNMEGLLLFRENNMNAIAKLHKTEEINKLFKNQCNEEVINKIKNFYFNENNLENEITKLENVCHFYSDLYFTKDFHRGLKHFHKHCDTPVYNYEFKFDGEINFYKNKIFDSRPTLRKSLKGASHADELSYLFWRSTPRLVPKPNSAEFRMCKTMSKLWTNFAKTGDPNSPDLSFVWHSAKTDNPKYLSLDGDNTRMVDGLLNGPRVNFWDDISDMLRSEQKL